MMCVFGCESEASIVRQSEKGTMIGLCSEHSHFTLREINYRLFKKSEGSLLSAMMRF
jgi:hypothetical protein